MAEVMKYDDFKDEGSENAVKVRNDFFLLANFIILALTGGCERQTIAFFNLHSVRLLGPTLFAD